MTVELAISHCHLLYKNSVTILVSTAVAGEMIFFSIAYARFLHYEDNEDRSYFEIQLYRFKSNRKSRHMKKLYPIPNPIIELYKDNIFKNDVQGHAE